MKYNICIIGATGAVGREVLNILKQRSFPVDRIKVFSSSRSAGTELPFGSVNLKVEELTDACDFSQFDFVFFTSSSSVSEKYAPIAARAGAIVIDNSSRFRMDPKVPLVIPEVNASSLDQAKNSRIIANPNCTTAQMVMMLKPLHDAFRIKRVILSSYQAVSGKGQKGVDEFKKQVQDFVSGKASKPEAFAHPIAFNCLPHIDVFEENGFTGEENKVMNETKKILGDQSIRVLATCVRVPVLNCHSESVAIETEKPVTSVQAREVLRQMPGVKVIDEPRENRYPLAMEISGQDDVFVGRIRHDPSLENGKNGLTFWIVADNLRKGAALNAVQIAEAAIERGLSR